MAKYRVDIEGPGMNETRYFDAESDRDAAMLGKDIFFNVCNYGISRIDSDDAAPSVPDQEVEK